MGTVIIPILLRRNLEFRDISKVKPQVTHLACGRVEIRTQVAWFPKTLPYSQTPVAGCWTEDPLLRQDDLPQPPEGFSGSLVQC